jgi:hypothetical protein
LKSRAESFAVVLSQAAGLEIGDTDLNNNDLVNYADLIKFVNKWLYQEALLSEDIDRNGVVNLTDFAIFANEWLWEE